jgi:hypothetical protein
VKHILDKGFRYKPSFDTDIRKTFERLRRAKLQADEERKEKVTQLPITNTRRSS